ncbi:response regulator [Psychromicrobium lacuslunae]|uniref:LuxR family transcriptional regulator n=1 Tax=Psychromicrobium lacuslunae TaxID=1618207 RepID=A0A0D4BVM8_9MICC|nr:response regulator transcription factor [Psychromicrobium lacuslunae]AJT40368.1 LuxR family transcriptional regulator [Psychromicrobium lacuslunae]
MSRKSIRVLLADDHAAIRQGLRMILSAETDLEVVGEAADGNTAVQMSQQLEPDVLLMDIRMPGMDGVEATRRITEFGTAKVLILTTFDLDDYVLAALRAGASGFLLKSASAEELLNGIRKVNSGHSVLATEVTEVVIRNMRAAASASVHPKTEPDLGELTERELEVLKAVGAGWTNQQAARRLGIAETTVKTHVSRIFSKLGLVSRVQAAIFCLENGISTKPGRDQSDSI